MLQLCRHYLGNNRRRLASCLGPIQSMRFMCDREILVPMTQLGRSIDRYLDSIFPSDQAFELAGFGKVSEIDSSGLEVTSEGEKTDCHIKKPIVDVISSLFEDGILMAVPKKRVTNARRKRRAYYAEGISPLYRFKECDKCGKKHPPHHLCPYCHEFNRYIRSKGNHRLGENVLK